MTFFEWFATTVAFSICMTSVLLIGIIGWLRNKTVGTIAIGSRWRHHSGREYTVVHLANEYSKKGKYPEVVVYQGDNKRVWAKTKTDFLRKMTLIQEATNGEKS